MNTLDECLNLTLCPNCQFKVCRCPHGHIPDNLSDVITKICEEILDSKSK